MRKNYNDRRDSFFRKAELGLRGALLAAVDPEIRLQLEELLAQHSTVAVFDQPAAALIEESTVIRFAAGAAKTSKELSRF